MSALLLLVCACVASITAHPIVIDSNDISIVPVAIASDMRNIEEKTDDEDYRTANLVQVPDASTKNAVTPNSVYVDSVLDSRINENGAFKKDLKRKIRKRRNAMIAPKCPGNGIKVQGVCMTCKELGIC